MDENITLKYADGNIQECEIIGVFDYNKKDYIAVKPLDGSKDTYIYGYKEDKDGKFALSDIEDDEEFKAVVAEFDAIMAE
ncbi:MAG: DUF1292 domain-containing protein [Clostridia bacterium]|nr:DUF1292 domain-containing protein [Clostridia bacterium]